MIKDRTFSARAENIRRILRQLAAFAVGTGLTLAPLTAYGAESPDAGRNTADGLERLALPPIPYLDTMPWSSWERGSPAIKVDTLLSPVLGPSGIRLDVAPPDRGPPRPAMS